MLVVHKMQLIEYEYTWQHQPRKGHKCECRLVSADGVYCQGVIKGVSWSRGGGTDPAAELKAMHAKFTDGSIWKMTKVVMSNGKK